VAAGRVNSSVMRGRRFLCGIAVTHSHLVASPVGARHSLHSQHARTLIQMLGSPARMAPPSPARLSAQTGGVTWLYSLGFGSSAPGSGGKHLLSLPLPFVRLQPAPGRDGNRCTRSLRQLPWRITIRSSRSHFVARLNSGVRAHGQIRARRKHY
jgi:hypothetical protein